LHIPTIFALSVQGPIFPLLPPVYGNCNFSANKWREYNELKIKWILLLGILSVKDLRLIVEMFSER